MAQRRMFSPLVTDSDAFLEMPSSAQNFYFHLGMRADDDGFVSNPKKILRMINGADDDLKILIGKRFVLAFENGVIVIKHWRMNNLIRKDWYRPTIYEEEKKLLLVKENGSYTEIDKDNTYLVNEKTPTRHRRLGKVSIGKDRIENTYEEESVKNTYGELEEVKLTDVEYNKLYDLLGEQNLKVLIFELDTYIASKNVKYKNHYATILNWAKRKADQKTTYQNKGRGVA